MSIKLHEFLKLLKDKGFEIVSQKGSHIKLKDGRSNTIIVPASKNVKMGTYWQTNRKLKLYEDNSR